MWRNLWRRSKLLHYNTSTDYNANCHKRKYNIYHGGFVNDHSADNYWVSDSDDDNNTDNEQNYWGVNYYTTAYNYHSTNYDSPDINNNCSSNDNWASNKYFNEYINTNDN